MCLSLNSSLVDVDFREPEKRGGEKKPTGSTSPPVGSPAPPPAPSSSGSVRSAFLPYAPAFNVLLQCLKMVCTPLLKTILPPFCYFLYVKASVKDTAIINTINAKGLFFSCRKQTGRCWNWFLTNCPGCFSTKCCCLLPPAAWTIFAPRSAAW